MKTVKIIIHPWHFWSSWSNFEDVLPITSSKHIAVRCSPQLSLGRVNYYENKSIAPHKNRKPRYFQLGGRFTEQVGGRRQLRSKRGHIRKIKWEKIKSESDKMLLLIYGVRWNISLLYLMVCLGLFSRQVERFALTRALLLVTLVNFQATGWTRNYCYCNCSLCVLNLWIY